MEKDMKFLILLHFALPALALASVTKLTPQGGSVEALSVGKPSFIKIRGKCEPAKGELQIDGKKAGGVFEFQVATLDTGIDLRNEHMREKYLQVREYPTAKLEIKDLRLNDEFSLAHPKISEQPFEGSLTLHGVTKPVRGKFTVGENRGVAADFKIKLSDFNVEIPKYLGVTVADEVNVEVKIAELKETK
jgi:polyisoprenoid-binding protein YceI